MRPRFCLAAVFLPLLLFTLQFGAIAAEACPLESDSAPGAAAPVTASMQAVEWVQPSDLVSTNSSALAVDIRPESIRQVLPLEGMPGVELLDLRNLLLAATGPVAIVSDGYSDRHLEKRIGSWARMADRVQIVQGGAAGWLLAGAEEMNDQQLQSALAVPDAQVAPLLLQPDWVFLKLDDVGELPASLRYHGTAPTWPVDPGALSELTDLLRTEPAIEAKGLLLLDRDGQRSSELAVSLSRTLARPVFFAQGGLQAAEREAARFADINRQPSGLARGCQ